MLSTRTEQTAARRHELRDKALRLYMDDHSFRDIAKDLDVCYQTAGVYVHDALRALGPIADTRRLRGIKVDQLLLLSKSMLPAAMGEGRIRC